MRPEMIMRIQKAGVRIARMPGGDPLLWLWLRSSTASWIQNRIRILHPPARWASSK
jgi:hypothetical protein